MFGNFHTSSILLACITNSDLKQRLSSFNLLKMQGGPEELSFNRSTGTFGVITNNRTISLGLFDPYKQQALDFNNLVQVLVPFLLICDFVHILQSIKYSLSTLITESPEDNRIAESIQGSRRESRVLSESERQSPRRHDEKVW